MTEEPIQGDTCENEHRNLKRKACYLSCCQCDIVYHDINKVAFDKIETTVKVLIARRAKGCCVQSYLY